MSATTFDRTTRSAAPSSGSGLRETRLIIRREILTRLGNRTILTATGLLALFAGAVAGIGGWFLVDSFGGTGAMSFDPRAIFATAMISALLASLVYSASSLTSGVVEEKSSRIVEILLTKIGIVPLLAGKMIGIGLVTLVQLLAIGGTAVVGFSVVGGWSLINVAVGPSLLWFLLWFLLGYVIFAALNTTLASTVSRQEDLGTAVMPLSVLQMVLLVVSLYVLPMNMGNPWLEGLSFVPLFSSYLMPMRFALEDVSTWEMVLAAGISVAAIPALFWLATVIYRNNALRTGSRVSLQQSLTSDEMA
ncbi:ABC transporter permease [Paenarthrobacter sp. NPDC090517]|uniref:ABC transporter permease n=1 Tax=Paenarthrobacter sp. NPDC090517 TaxID=3364381 RepID=UPI0037FEDF62